MTPGPIGCSAVAFPESSFNRQRNPGAASASAFTWSSAPMNSAITCESSGASGRATLNCASSVCQSVLSLAVHPANPDIAYAGFQGTGIYKTLDGNTGWAPVITKTSLGTASMYSSGIITRSLAIDPANPERVYAGTSAPRDLLRTTDGGANWTDANAGLAHDTVNVVAIAPGVVDGEHWDVVDAKFAEWEGLKPGEKKAAVAKFVPIGRFATPDDIKGLAVFLASSDSDYILAQTYNVDGGNWMS